MYNSNVVLTLDKRRKKQDGTYPIILRLSHFGKTIGIKTGFSVLEKYWDDKKKEIKTSYKGIDNITRANNRLLKLKSKTLGVLTDLKDKNEISRISIADLKEKVVPSKKKVTFFAYTEKLIDNLNKAKRIGNAKSYRAILGVIKGFRKDKDFTFNELNLAFLKKLEIYHLSKGNSLNGLAVYMKTIRAIYNQAIKDGYAEKEAYPFDNYTIRTTKTKKRAIALSSIKKIEALELDHGSSLYRDRQIFMMSFYLMGTSYADLAHLKLENISDGRISFIRQRTKKPYDIKIPPPLWTILNEFIADKEKDDYILPIIKRTEPALQYKDVTWARQRYNKNLKKLAKMAGVEENLTSYVARHSYATIADEMEIPITAISKMLGHEKINTTQIYLDSLKKSTIDEYQEKIISSN